MVPDAMCYKTFPIADHLSIGHCKSTKQIDIHINRCSVPIAACGILCCMENEKRYAIFDKTYGQEIILTCFMHLELHGEKV